MADLARIKRNVAKMVGLSAPEADIDAYIASEGVTIDDVRAFKGGPTGLQGKPGKMDPAQAGVSENVTMDGKSVVPQAPSYKPDLMTATAATVNGLVNSVPFLQNTSDALMGAGGMLLGRDYGQTVEGLRKQREAIAQASPVARGLGEVAGSIGGVVALGAPKAGAEALGMVGNLGQRAVNSGLSSAGLAGLNSISQGNQGGDVLTDMGIGGAAGVAAPLVGAGVKKAGGAIADAVTGAAQNRLTSAAIKGAPDAAALKSAASEMFEASTGGNPLMVSDTSFFRFLGGVKQVANKFRINPDNDKQAVGLLETLMRIADDTASNTRVDMKDLHLVRQLAQKVAQSSEGRDSAFAKTVIRQMDDYIRSLKPADILGGADPTEAANQLMTGISTWARASKVSLVEEAIRRGEVAASGPEKGIRNALRAIVKSDDWSKFNAAEKKAILDVVEGTAGSNILKLLGTFGFGGNTATNGIGGAAGMALGSLAGGPLGMVAGPIIGSAAKKASEAMTGNLANRALGAVATPNIPIARQAPNLLAPARVPIELLVKGGGLAAAR